MNTNSSSTFIPQSNQPSADRDSTGQVKTPIFHVQTGLRAGVTDYVYGNDAARASQAAKGSADFLANWYR